MGNYIDGKEKHNTRGMVYKKISFTGQETFFPRDKILERIELILSMKEETSLMILQICL